MKKEGRVGGSATVDRSSVSDGVDITAGTNTAGTSVSVSATTTSAAATSTSTTLICRTGWRMHPTPIISCLNGTASPLSFQR